MPFSFSYVVSSLSAGVQTAAGVANAVKRVPRDFREYARSLVPFWLSNAVGERFVGFLGLVNDTAVEGAQHAILSPMMFSRTFAYNTLNALGAERLLPRFPAETHEAYRSRLHQAWDLWEQAGSARGIELMFELFGVTATVVRNNEWNWDGDADASRFWVVVTDHPWTKGWHIGASNIIGGGQVIGGSFSAEEVAAMRGIVSTFKPADYVCESIVVVFDEDQWALEQPDGTWGYWKNRSSAASYISV
jgi:hypothetical protein